MIATCFFLGGLLWITNGDVASPIGPQSVVERSGPQLAITVGETTTKFDLSPHNASLSVETIITLCDEQALRKLEEKEGF